MQSLKALKMINDNRIEELKKMLEDDIYTESLKKKPNAKKRYSAMKKYFAYHETGRECLQKPCAIRFEDKDYISFCNSWSMALTTEDIGEIELYDENNGKYPNVIRLLRFDGIKKKIDFSEVFAEARSKGYRLNKGEVDARFKYVMLYDGTYYKVGLIEATFGIIDDGEPALTYHQDGVRGPLTIQTSLGIAMVMPVKFDDIPEETGKVVIEVE